MRLFFVVVGLVALLKIAVQLDLFLRSLFVLRPSLASEVYCCSTLALALGSAAHHARRGTVIPPRPLACTAGAVALALLLALAFADPADRAGWTALDLAAHTSLALFHVVGCWLVVGAMLGGPFTCPAGHPPTSGP